MHYSIFNKKFNATLEERRNNELEAENAVKTKATEDLASWSKQREVRLNAKKDKNRIEEQVLVESFQSEGQIGSVWDRVTKLIDVNAETIDSKKSDVARLKKLFIQLKNEPKK